MKYCYTLRIVLAVLSILMNLSGGLPEAAAQNVDFPDTNLAAAVRDALGIEATDPIPQTDLAGLTQLIAHNVGVSNLTGLEQATGLTWLSLFSNQISDLSALSGLTNLTLLNLGSNQIRDISALSGLTNLTLLYLQSNQISDLSALSGLTNLTLLNLGSNQISDLSALSGLTNLTTLDLSFNPISDISVLSGLTNLTILWLNRNQISDISVLSGLTNLTSLALQSNQISDISVLSGLTNLTSLALDSNEIRDISVLSGLTNLTNLTLAGNEIRDISALSGLTNLTLLYLHSNAISDISALSGLTNLIDLDIDNNEIRDISALSGLTNLTSLDISSNQISDISALSGLTNIEWLNIAGNEIRDISPLSTLSSLTTLVIDQGLDENNPGLLARILSSNVQISFRFRQTRTAAAEAAARAAAAEAAARAAVARTATARTAAARNRLKHCGLGWAPHSQYQHHGELPKVMIYALEFEYDPASHGRYICKTIEIRTGDDAIENLAGWHLYLGTLYNPSRIPMTIPEEHSQITDRILRLTPEMLGLETFPCNTVNGISHPLPGVQYVLKTDENVLIDTAFSCFVWGQNAYTTVNNKNVESPRRISSQALREMDTPRIERYITNPTGIFITDIPFEDFAWDRAVLSDWLLGLSEETQVAGGNAPFFPYKKLATSWAAVKQPESFQRNEKRR